MSVAFTPRETVSELDRYIVGQDPAKRAVAVALRNRWRRQQVADDLRDEIVPKNIIMIGPTGCGKTEIARRLAKIAKAPFVKVEASKFTEVGYVGRDVESMIRDLVENAVQLVREEQLNDVKHRAAKAAERRLIGLLADKRFPRDYTPGEAKEQKFGPFSFTMNAPGEKDPHDQEDLDEIREALRKGELEDEEVSMEVPDQGMPFMTVFGQNGQEEMNLKDMMSQMPGFKQQMKPTSMPVSEARKVLADEEATKLIDDGKLKREAIRRTEELGIVFLDEIDKVGARKEHGGADVSREGVQRDLLPVVEGSTVGTKYGPIKTDHILFVAAGAFHVSKVSDLIPELQGRFPIRVELEPLSRADFVRILREPKNALTKQYEALLGTEKVTLSFEDSAIEEIARYAEEANTRSENIGARRLHTVMEALLEQLSFSASERGGEKVKVDADYVKEALEPIVGSKELSKFIL